MEPTHQHHMTEDEYLTFEHNSPEKHEFIRGEVINASGASPRRCLITANLAGTFGNKRTAQSCLVFVSKLRINVAAAGLYAYPDVTVVCGRLEYHRKDRDVVLNPTMIVEVISDPRERFDRVLLAPYYRQSPSLKEYMFVSQDQRLVEHYRRIEGNQWLLTETTGERAIFLQCIGAEISLEEIYDKLELL